MAGVTLEISFARFTASMATFNKERASSRRFCRRESVSMVESRGVCEKRCCRRAVRKSPSPNPNADERRFFHGAPRANKLFDEGNCIRGRNCPHVIDQSPCFNIATVNATGIPVRPVAQYGSHSSITRCGIGVRFTHSETNLRGKLCVEAERWGVAEDDIDEGLAQSV